MKPKSLTDKEMHDLTHKIAKKTFNFFIKMIEREIIIDKHKNVCLNDFVSIFFNAISNMDANYLEWMKDFYERTTRKPANYLHMKQFLLDGINKCISNINKEKILN